MSQSVFENLKVVELASVLAGPSVGMFFAELGAQVIKIENKNADGDVTRQWRLPSETINGPSAYYSSVNWNKEVIFLDFKNDSDLKDLNIILADADIVIANFKKGDDVKFGLDYNSLKKINSKIIYGQISGFGNESNRVAFDLILQAETGFMSMNGQPDSLPTKMPLALIDVLAAHQLKEGILCALLERNTSKQKSFHVSVSLYESAIASLINQATNCLMNENIPQRIGSLHPNIAPYGEVFTTKDNRLITLAIGNNRQFDKLCSFLNLSELVLDELYCENQQRVENRKELEKILQSEISKLECEYILESLIKLYVPVGEIKNLKQVFDSKEAKALLLYENIEGRKTIRPKSTVFKIQE